MVSNVSDLIVVTVAGIAYSKPVLLKVKRGDFSILCLFQKKLRNSSDVYGNTGLVFVSVYNSSVTR